MPTARGTPPIIPPPPPSTYRGNGRENKNRELAGETLCVAPCFLTVDPPIMPAIKLPPYAPRIELVIPEPWRPTVNMMISALPARFVADPRFRQLPVRVLQTFGALCLFTSVNGICYPTQKLICQITGFDKADVSRDLLLLEEMGYITRVLSKSKRTHHALRRHVKYRGWDEKPPPREIPGDDARVPWPFRGRDRKKTTTTTKGEADMIRTTTEKAAPKPDPYEIARQNQEAMRHDRETLDKGLRIAAYFADEYYKRTGRPGAAQHSVATARRWLQPPFSLTEKQARAHIDDILTDHPPHELPDMLRFYRDPVKATEPLRASA